MRCINCGKDLYFWDLVVVGNKRWPVCRGGYDCYAQQRAVVNNRHMVKVYMIAKRYYKFTG